MIDHLCRNRACVNPWHMDAVPQRINALRGVGACAGFARASACGNGHLYTSETTRLNDKGHRVCKVCVRGWQAAYVARKRLSTST